VCWIIDHKTFRQSPNMEFILNMNEQFTGYMWAFQKLFPKDKLGGCIYDGVYKGLPTEPDLLQNGTMSKRWIKTTAALYQKRLLEADLDLGDYSEFLQRLRERDKGPENPFFKRVQIPKDQGEVYGWGHNLRSLVKDMKPRCNIYPNRRWEGCWDCGKDVRQICGMIHGGASIAADTLLSKWMKTEPPTQKKVRTLRPKKVSSLDQLAQECRDLRVNP